ncbi:DUF4190 domain-containing protein [Streptomyces sp. NPDC002851]
MAIPPPPQGQQPPPYGQGGAQPPYGMPGPAPYGPQGPYHPYGPGPYAPPPPVNGLAITSLVLGLLCGLLAPLGLIFGLVSLSQIKKRGERGKGMAIAGVVLSSIGVVFLVLAFTLGWAASFWAGFTSAAEDSRRNTPFTLDAGDCFNSPTGKLEGETTDVDIVPCTEEHDGEAYGSFRLTGGDSAYPGESAIAARANATCARFAKEYIGDVSALPDSVYDYFFYPTRQSWRLGDREVTCLVGDENGGTLTGSVRDTGRGGDGSSGGSSGSSGGSSGGASGGSSGGTSGSSGGATSGGSGDLDGGPGAGRQV